MSDGRNKIVRAAFSEEDAAKLTGVSRAQLRNWDRTGFFRPEFADANRRLAYSRVYSFRDLANIQVLNTLRNEAKIPMQHLRKVRQKLAHLGDDVWSKTRLYVLNKRVVFDNPETQEREEVVSSQRVLDIPLQVVAKELEREVRLHWERKDAQIGKVERRRNLVHHQAVIAGTRIPVDTIKSFAEEGFSVAEIIAEYPSLTKRDVEAALGFSSAA